MSTASILEFRRSPIALAELPVVGAGELIPTVHGEWVDYANFDHGASTPALVSVAAAVERASLTYSSVHRGKGWNSRVSSALYEAAREEVAAFVMPRGAADPDALRALCAARLAPYKVPRAVIVVEDLPRNSSGKVLKAELVARLQPL